MQVSFEVHTHAGDFGIANHRKVQNEANKLFRINKGSLTGESTMAIR